MCSYSLDSLEGVIEEIVYGTTTGVLMGDTGSSDYGSYISRAPPKPDTCSQVAERALKTWPDFSETHHLPPLGKNKGFFLELHLSETRDNTMTWGLAYLVHHSPLMGISVNMVSHCRPTTYFHPFLFFFSAQGLLRSPSAPTNNSARRIGK